MRISTLFAVVFLAAAAARRRLESRLVERERELGDLKGGAIDEVSRKIDDLRQELSDQIVALSRRLDERRTAPVAPAAPAAPREPVGR